jgi:hypothetical protein
MRAHVPNLGHRAFEHHSRRFRRAGLLTVAVLVLLGAFAGVAHAGVVSNVTVDNTNPSNAAGGRTVYTVGFTTSSTGGLSNAAGSQITLSFPASTNLTHLNGSSVTVPAVSSSSIGNCFASASTVVTCNLFGGDSIAAGANVVVVVDGVQSPTTTGANTLTVATTSDTSNSNTFQIAAAQSISQPTLLLSSTAAGAGNVTYTVGFTTSSTGGLAAAAGSQITISLPATTNLTHLNGSSVTDTTAGGGSIGNCFASAATVVTCNLFGGDSIAASHGVRVVISGVTNPTAGTTAAVSASTTSDPAPVASGTSTITPPPPPPPPAASAPLVVPAAPAPRGATAAAVSGTVNPEGRATTVVFEYGLDPSLRGPGVSTALYDHSTAPQQVGSDSSNHAVSANLSGLVPNALYHVRVVATNSAGTTNGPDQTFKTQQAPTPPPPVLGQTQNAQPVSGKTFILVNGKFVPLTGNTKIPSGATIDSLHGTLSLTSATGVGKKLQTGTFGGAVFKVVQARAGAAKGLTTLSLVNNAFKGAPSFASCTIKHASKASAAAVSKKTLQLLRGRDSHGKFRSKGRYAAATTRGTVWSIADRCDGTLTQVNAGTVVVSDLVRHRNITVRAHHSYLAKAPR